MNLRDALALATEVRNEIAPFCLVGAEDYVFCEIAGSVRRRKPDMIKDVEVVAVPNSRHLFELRALVNKKWGEPQVGAFPSKYTRIRGRMNIDLFWCTPETFGLNFFIRTGSDHFVRRALADWKKTTNGGRSEDAQLRKRDGTIVPTPTEEAVFAALGWRFVNPELRV